MENLQGLTTLKIYQADERRQEEMNQETENFRKITMKVLTMQLNSITIMDLVAYGGAALGGILAVRQFLTGEILQITMKVLTMQLNSITIMDLVAYGGAALGGILAVRQFLTGEILLSECLFIILLAADFFLPMRLLGSFFHIAMNGMAANDKIFKLLDLPEPVKGTRAVSKENGLCSRDLTFAYEKERPVLKQVSLCDKIFKLLDLPEPVKGTRAVSKENGLCSRDLTFAYEKERPVLKQVSLCVEAGTFTAIVGESGCGKSTLASVFMGKNQNYEGEVLLGGNDGIPLSEIAEESLMKQITYVGHAGYLFKGTIRENLLLAKPNGTDEEFWEVLEKMKLADFLRSEQGLDTMLAEKGSNFSGGQCQRLVMARALLHDSPIYIFDEATSNIDAESENDMMEQIYRMKGKKTVLLISHRLANVTAADKIYVLEQGKVTEQGNHEELIAQNGVYAKLWNTQQELEYYRKEKAS